MAANVRFESDDGGGELSSEQAQLRRWRDLRSGLLQQVSSEHSKAKRSEIDTNPPTFG